MNDLQSPLAYVLSNLEFVDNELAKHENDLPLGRTAELRHLLREALLGATRMRQILEDINDGGALPLDDQADLHRVLLSCIKIARTEIDHRARVITEFGAIPEVYGTESTLARLFQGLIGNAAKAVAGDPKNEPVIRVTTRPDGADGVLVEITDSGEGITPEHVGLVFEPFFTRRSPNDALGLGLRACRKLVDDLGATISVHTIVGRGTTFRVRLGTAAPGSRALRESDVRFAPSKPPVRRLPFRQLG